MAIEVIPVTKKPVKKSTQKMVSFRLNAITKKKLRDMQLFLNAHNYLMCENSRKNMRNSEAALYKMAISDMMEDVLSDKKHIKKILSSSLWVGTPLISHTQVLINDNDKAVSNMLNLIQMTMVMVEKKGIPLVNISDYAVKMLEIKAKKLVKGSL